jgi:hypothetical protein
MRAELLDVVTCVANPLRWNSRLDLYRAFERHMLDSGVRLTTVECAYGDRPFECGGTPGVAHVALRSHSVIWNKEALLNAGIARLPHDWKYVAWIDADVFFRRRDWASETVQALQLHDVVQPWTHCYDLGPNGEHLQVHTAFAKIVQDGKPVEPKGRHGYEFAHPGYAWAAKRQALELVGGLIEGALGAGDHHMALALIGRVHESVPAGIHPNYLAPLVTWQERAAAPRRQPRRRARHHRAPLARPQARARVCVALGHPDEVRVRSRGRSQAECMGAAGAGGEQAGAAARGRAILPESRRGLQHRRLNPVARDTGPWPAALRRGPGGAIGSARSRVPG